MKKRGIVKLSSSIIIKVGRNETVTYFVYISPISYCLKGMNATSYSRLAKSIHGKSQKLTNKIITGFS